MIYNDGNWVNSDNYEETMKGYIIRACKIMEIDKDTIKKIMLGIKWATSEMTMEDARREFVKNG